MSASDAVTALKAKFPQVTDRASRDCPAVDVPAGELLAVLQTLRDEHAFDLLSDVTAIDWAEGASPRFVAVYHLFSTTTRAAVRVAAACTGDEATPTIPSVVSLWPGANWHERETYDMFGIKFEGHPDLRRILMWDGYPYHPLRKEFPLAGIETALPDAEIAEETKAKVIAAPMAGGPFVASAGEMNLTEAEPRAKDESWNERTPKPGA
ncbi:MAG: NADH-quinone oxidoreductase subunit C [Verrucomicrobia bacterium]|nr:NADH-quinone oxidoreductase subunit C [Verrucomicrobiota bacterium]